MIKFIKRILGIDNLEKKVEFLLSTHDGSRSIIAFILKTLDVSPQQFVELIRFNPHELINYNREVAKLMDEVVKEEEKKLS